MYTVLRRTNSEFARHKGQKACRTFERKEHSYGAKVEHGMELAGVKSSFQLLFAPDVAQGHYPARHLFAQERAIETRYRVSKVKIRAMRSYRGSNVRSHDHIYPFCRGEYSCLNKRDDYAGAGSRALKQHRYQDSSHQSCQGIARRAKNLAGFASRHDLRGRPKEVHAHHEEVHAYKKENDSATSPDPLTSGVDAARLGDILTACPFEVVSLLSKRRFVEDHVRVTELGTGGRLSPASP
jgi:hypothetical protein